MMVTNFIVESDMLEHIKKAMPEAIIEEKKMKEDRVSVTMQVRSGYDLYRLFSAGVNYGVRVMALRP